VFLYQKVNDSGTTAATRDVIFGAFGGHPNGDRIDVHLIDANRYVDGNQAFTFIGTKSFTKAKVGEIRVNKVDDGYWSVLFDLDKDNSAEMVIRVHSTKALVEADFIL
jgi:hypothetical protein